MAFSGTLVLHWPLVLGCDAAGVVVKAGSKAVSSLGPLKVGDKLLGCTRLGDKPYATCQEYVRVV
jgi:NADPH:quinone reductase-like Zn-dependent oxidoreductase